MRSPPKRSSGAGISTPRVDASVRVQVARLRDKLDQYYLREGRDAELRITIPVGTHRLVVAPPEQEVSRPGQTTVGLSPRGQFVLGFVTLLLAGACLTLLATRRAAIEPTWTATAPEPLPPFWQQFTDGDKPVRLVLPTPAFLEWELKKPVVVRDYRYNELKGMAASPLLRDFIEKFGPPTLSEQYSIAHDAESAVNLAAFLSRRGVSVEGTTPGHLERDRLTEPIHIWLGNIRTVDDAKRRAAGLNFQPDADLGFRNMHPREGEPAAFRREFQSRRRQLVPGLIVFRRQGANNDLLLLSENTKGLVTYLTNPEGLESLDRYRKAGGAWGNFELLVVAEVDADRVLRVQPAAYRAISHSN